MREHIQQFSDKQVFCSHHVTRGGKFQTPVFGLPCKYIYLLAAPSSSLTNQSLLFFFKKKSTCSNPARRRNLASMIYSRRPGMKQLTCDQRYFTLYIYITQTLGHDLPIPFHLPFHYRQSQHLLFSMYVKYELLQHNLADMQKPREREKKKR